MKRILFLGHYSGGKYDYDTRHYFLAKQLIKMGHKATILNAAYSHRLAFPRLIKEHFFTSNDEGVNFISIKTPHYRGNGIKRLINMFSFVINTFIHCKKIIEAMDKIDVIVMASPHPFQFYVSKHLSKKLKAKLIIDVKDIWPLALTEVGINVYHPFVLMCKITEKLMYKYSDMIISPLSNIQQYFTDNRYINTVFHVPTGIDIDFYDTIICTKKYFPSNKFIVGYMGGLNSDNAIDFLLENAILLKEACQDILFIIVGKGGYEKYYKEKYSKHSNILFFDSAPKNDVFCMMKECDVLYKALLPINIFNYGTAQLKQNEYMYSGTPILHVFDFPKSDVIKKCGCGFVSRHGDTETFRKNLLTFYNMTKEERKEIGKKGQEFVIQFLSIKNTAKEIEKLL